MRHAQLRAFHNVAVHGGFSRAADAMNLTQPALSDQVRKLEAEYDVRLFDRTRKQIAITEAGTRLLEITRRLFEVAQRRAERHALKQRKSVLRTDDWLDEYLGFAGREG